MRFIFLILGVLLLAACNDSSNPAPASTSPLSDYMPPDSNTVVEAPPETSLPGSLTPPSV